MGRSLSDLAVFLGKRLLLLIPTLLGVLVITFVLSTVVTPNPCQFWFPKIKPAQVPACISRFGLDQPLPTRFVDYLVQLGSGNWGTNPNAVPVLPQILADVPETIELVLSAMFLMIVVGIPLGVVAANHAGRLGDHLVRVFYLSGWAMPTYVGALLLALLVGPATGLPYQGAFTNPNPPIPQPTHFSVVDGILSGQPYYAGDALAHLVLPATSLAFLNLGIATRMTRSSMLETLPMDYVKTARMKGLSEFWVLYKHALRNSLITTTTVLGVTGGQLLASTVVIEEIFQWPGIGEYAYTALTQNWYAAVYATVIVFAIGVVVANLAADLLYGLLDPRVEWR
ncbi:MAG TPA: ABC transporter permease [Thermoplasmata archaeon]|nr:ABC transporter permease [Thermoplasmata archaeon]HUJ77592.1 ABC transporter permease [Thermoplasmata archaeon]